MIPGNERAIGTVQDNLVRRGVHLMTDMDHLVHVSGHPARDELRRLYRMVKPGSRCRCMASGAICRRMRNSRERRESPVLLEDGDILQLAPGNAEVVDSAPTGRLVPDGGRLVPFGRRYGGASQDAIQRGDRGQPGGG